MRTNKAKAKLREGKSVVGSLISFYSPAVVEILATAGLDFVLIDAEHGGLTVSEVEHMVRAAESFDVTSIVRVPSHDPATIYGFLDRGVQGIVAPHVNSKAEAEQVADACRYHPQGHRGHFAIGRPARWGAMERFEYFRRANEEVLVIAQIEEYRAVENLKGILSVPGIDMILLGPGDLAQSMGWPPRERVDQVLYQVVKETVAAGKWVSAGVVPVGGDQEAKRYIELGSRFWEYSPQAGLRRGAEEYMSWLKGLGASL